MKRLLLVGLACATVSVASAQVLIFSKTKGYRHASIVPGKVALLKLCKEAGWKADTTENAQAFSENNLRKYKVVVFLSTTGDVLDPQQQEAFQNWYRKGNGFFGIHAAADTEYDWPWYGKLVGAWFKSHPKTQRAAMVQVSKFGKGDLPTRWERNDEWYNYKEISPAIQAIYNLDESSYEGGENGAVHPIVWFQEYDGGRSFYCGIGHTEESYADPMFLSQVKQGLTWTMKKKK